MELTATDASRRLGNDVDKKAVPNGIGWHVRVDDSEGDLLQTEGRVEDGKVAEADNRDMELDARRSSVPSGDSIPHRACALCMTLLLSSRNISESWSR